MSCVDKTWSSTPFLLSTDNQVRWHAETKHGHPHPFCYPETIKSDGTWRQTWSSAPYLPSGDNQVRWNAETKHCHPHPIWHQETIKSDGRRRQTWSSTSFFAIQRQSSPMACGDKTWSSEPFLLSIDNQVRWHAKTKHGHPHLLCHPETIKYNMLIRTLFAIQRQISLMAREEKTWSSTTSLPSRDN